MKKSILLLLYLMPAIVVFAQNKTYDFEINQPETKITKSLYSNIAFLDSREDTTQMGIVQLGAFNRKARVVPKTALQQQFQQILQSLTDSSAGQGSLLLQLRQCSFAEVTGAMSEKGYCYIRAALYSKNESRYQNLSSIDTVVFVKSMDVTKALFRNGSKTICDFIGNVLLKNAASGNTLSLNDIVHIDSIEKSRLKIYTDSNWQNGLYASWESFKNQVPDKPVFVELKNGQLKSVKTEGADGKQEKVKSKDNYAFVYEGQPFVATEFGFYPLEKRNGDLFFTGKAKVTANSSDVIAASFFFGIIGGLLASNASSNFDMKIDHVNGGFIMLREIVSTTSD